VTETLQGSEVVGRAASAKHAKNNRKTVTVGKKSGHIAAG
jgi:hypothetical protein